MDERRLFGNMRIGAPYQTKKSALEWKIEGNALFGLKKYDGAIESYTEGLNSPHISHDVTKDILSNRAMAFLNLRCFQSALQDLDQLLLNHPNHFKGISRKGLTLCGLQRFSEAIEFLRAQLLKFEGEEKKNIQAILYSAKVMHKQSVTGEYNITKLYKGAGIRQEGVGDFTGPVRVELIPGKGKGLVATRDIKAGELILLHKAFAIVFPEDYATAPTSDDEPFIIKLAKAVAKRLQFDPSLRFDIHSLYAGPDHPIPSTKEEMLGVGVDMARINSICQYNSFGLTWQAGMRQNIAEEFTAEDSGLWILPSYLNHSCWDCNALWLLWGDLFVLRSFRPIKQGEEILISYISPTALDRQQQLSKYGFKCSCTLCQIDQDPSEDGKRRMHFLEEINKKNVGALTGRVLKKGVKDVEALLQKLEKFNSYKKTPIPSVIPTLLFLSRHFSENFQKSDEAVRKTYSLAEDSPLLGCRVRGAMSMKMVYMMYGDLENAAKWKDLLDQDMMLYLGTLELERDFLEDEFTQDTPN